MAASTGVDIALAASRITALIFRSMMQNLKRVLHPMEKLTSGQSHIHPGWRWISERGLQVTTGDATLARYAAFISLNLPEIEDIIPADGSLFVVFKRGEGMSENFRAALAASLVGMQGKAGALHEIAVEYGGAAGPDLPALAEQAGMDVTAYINSHMAVEYSVAFLGFQPGFPYLRGLPRAMHTPRRASPRIRVAAGSVAIGGAYTGIYSASGPGGWQIIGHTTAVMFDAQRDVPALLLPGDRVRFVSR